MFFKIGLAIFVITAVVALVFFNRGQTQKPDITGPIVFFGDSITAGVGAALGEDFPTLVGRKLNVQVVNAGVSGDTSGSALARINQDVISKNPSIVVVELGGNDFLQRVSLEETKKNFKIIMEKLKASNAKIVVVSVRTSPLNDQYISFEKELAKKYQSIYVDNILKGVLSDPKLMADSIHPNARGYEIIAERLTAVLRPRL